MTKLEQFFKDQTQILKAQSIAASNINHRNLIGNSRETFIKEFIKKSFPSKFVIGAGEIFDSEGKCSKQCDVVIYDELMPVLDYSGSQQFLAEGVFSHIEVKSNLTSEELKTSLDVTKSVKSIKRKIDAIMHTGDLPQKVFSCVFAYNGISKEAARKTLDEYYKQETEIDNKIDAICVLGEYIILKIPDYDGITNLVGLETKDNTLTIFFTELYRSMYKNWMGEPDLLKYIENTTFKKF
ncbi:hypothetical protein M0R01_00755 [bacterium]|nr:hypothetical protein [bacterium]